MQDIVEHLVMEDDLLVGLGGLGQLEQVEGNLGIDNLVTPPLNHHEGKVILHKGLPAVLQHLHHRHQGLQADSSFLIILIFFTVLFVVWVPAAIHGLYFR